MMERPGFASRTGIAALLVSALLASVAGAETTAEREQSIHRFLIEAREATPNDELRDQVRSYLNYQPQVMVAHEEGGHEVPKFDIPTAAQGTLNRWTFKAARDGAVAAFRRGEFGGSSILTMQTDRFTRPVKNGMLAALAGSDATILHGARDWIISHEGGADFGEPLGVIATRTADADLFEYVLERSNGPVTLRMINAAGSILSRDEAVRVLSSCLDRDDIASAALFGLGGLADQSSAARNIVIDRLSDPALGASAAAVIAKSDDPRMLDQAAARLSDGGLTGQRALLALRLNNGPAARGYAREYLNSGADARLKSEAATWLDQ